MTYLLIAFGSAIGGVARYACAAWVATWSSAALPWGTIAVNVVGSGLIGALAALGPNSAWPLGADARNFLMIGVLGGFTTFSSFSLQTFDLLRAQQWWHAGANVLISVAVCLAAVACGYALVALLTQPRTS